MELARVVEGAGFVGVGVGVWGGRGRESTVGAVASCVACQVLPASACLHSSVFSIVDTCLWCSVQIESEERHAQELRAARAQLQSKMREAEDALKGDIARLESALNSSDSFMRDLERKLLEAQEMGRKTKDDITFLQRELNQSRSEATMLQHKLTATEEVIEKNKVMFAEQLKKVASDAQSEARVLAIDAATKVVAASAAAEAANLNPRLRTGVASKVPGSLPGKMKLQLKKASEGMPEEGALASKGLASDLAVELDGSFVSEERDSAQDSPEKPRALNPLKEMLAR
jgi:CHASE3 domain sensor protein